MSLQPLAEEGVSIDWRPWRMPDDANPPAKPEGYKEGAMQFLKQLQEETGLSITPPAGPRDTYLAHIGAAFVQANYPDLLEKYHQRVFQAIWENNEEIDKEEILAKIANEVGIDSDEFLQSLSKGSYKDAVDDVFAEAKAEKIWTIPAYIGEKGEIQVFHYKDIPSLSDIEKIL